MKSASQEITRFKVGNLNLEIHRNAKAAGEAAAQAAAKEIKRLASSGADLGVMADATTLLLPGPRWPFILFFAGICIYMQIFLQYTRYVAVLKWLTLSLFSYFAAVLFANVQWAEMALQIAVPHLTWNTGYITTIVAVFGTTISPYLFFWQSDLEVEEEKRIGRTRLWQRQGASTGELTYAAWDVNIGMLFSNLVMYFIILATGATLFKAGKT